MKLINHAQLILVALGALGIVFGIRDDNVMLVAMSAILWIGCAFIDNVILSKRIRKLEEKE